VPHDVPADTVLASIQGDSRTIEDWTTTFQLVLFVVDPFTHESSWLIDTGARIVHHFAEADCRAGLLVTGTEGNARQFCGPWAERLITFADPDRSVVAALGLEALPALVHIDQRHTVHDKAEGWDPEAWERVAAGVAEMMSWSKPLIPAPGDPQPFAGSAAAG
jgi:hypothetical protein